MKKVLIIAAVSEAATGLALMIVPSLVGLFLSQMSSGWRETANRVILLPDVGGLQIAVVAADRIVPITGEP